MPIFGVQYRFRELGRLRLGDLDTSGAKPRPKRLETWRLTSPSEELLARAAGIWGGEVGTWSNAPTEGEQFELTTEVSVLPVLIPPQDVDARQFYELWTAAGVKRRCDGVTDFISGRPCICAQKEVRDCVPTTQLLAMLPELPDVGVWRLVSRGWNAAAEIPQTVKLLRQIAGPDTFAEAELAIEARTTKTENAQGKPETHNFTVPVVRLPFSLASLIAQAPAITTGPGGRVPLAGERPELPADARFNHNQDADWGERIALPEDSAFAEGEGPEAEPSSETPVPARGRRSKAVSDRPSPGPSSPGEGHHPSAPTSRRAKTSSAEGMVPEENSGRAAVSPDETPSADDEPAPEHLWAVAAAAGMSGNVVLKAVRALYSKGVLQGTSPATQSAVTVAELEALGIKEG